MLKESQSEVARLRQQLEVPPGASELVETQDVRMSVCMRVCVHKCAYECAQSRTRLWHVRMYICTRTCQMDLTD